MANFANECRETYSIDTRKLKTVRESTLKPHK